MPAYDYGFEAQAWHGGTRFRIQAPEHDLLSWRTYGSRSLAQGWFELFCPAEPGTRYRYRLPDGTQAADPAARAQSCDVHAWSVVVDPIGYAWHHRDWLGRH